MPLVREGKYPIGSTFLRQDFMTWFTAVKPGDTIYAMDEQIWTHMKMNELSSNPVTFFIRIDHNFSTELTVCFRNEIRFVGDTRLVIFHHNFCIDDCPPVNLRDPFKAPAYRQILPLV